MVTLAADGEAQLAILRVARVLLDAAAPADPCEEVPEWVRKLIATQGCVHEKIGAIDDRRILSTAARILEGGLKCHPHLLELYLDVLTAEERSSDSIVALSAVTTFALSLPQYKGEQYLSEQPMIASEWGILDSVSFSRSLFHTASTSAPLRVATIGAVDSCRVQ